MNRRLIAIILMCTPLALLVAIPAYAVFSFVFSVLIERTSGTVVPIIGTLVNVILGIVAMVGLLGILIGFPVGFLLFITDKSGRGPVQVKA